MLKLKEKTINQIVNSIVLSIRQKEGKSYTDEMLEQIWEDYIKRVDPHEKSYKAIIFNLLKKNYQEVFENIKEHPDDIMQWTFNRNYWTERYAEAESKFIVKLVKQEGQKGLEEAHRLAGKSYKQIDYAFDIYNPYVTGKLIEQTAKFSEELVNTTEDIIRNSIAAGLEVGESMDKLAMRVAERLGDNLDNRALMIARTETIYGSNAGAEWGYLQSGVVEGKEWLTAFDERTCSICMDMNGMRAYIGTSGWEKDNMTLEDVKSNYGLNFEYNEGEMPHPPIHPRCRCSIVAVTEMVTINE